MIEEAKYAWAYHEIRCQQELQRINEARCERSRRAHIRLFQLHESESARLWIECDPGIAPCASQSWPHSAP
jgi:hypothetical protein